MAGTPGVVTVRLPQSLAEHASGRRALSLAVPGTVPLRTVLALLRADVPAVGRRVQDEAGAVRRFVNVYVGDTECRALDGLATPVAPGTTIHIIPSVAGG